MEITVKALEKSFGDNKVVNRLSLHIKNNSFTTFLGSSGCGKTTFLRMIAGLETPDKGEIDFDGVPVFSSERKINISPEKRNLGFVFQDFALWPHMNVFDNVAFALRARKMKDNLKERVEQALQTVRLGGYEKRMPHHLSGGQQQRVALARAIVSRPDLILMDEPLSALDAILREEMREEIKSIVSSLKTTAIFVTHDQSEAMSMSDCIVVMNKGNIEQCDCPENIYNHPSTKFTADFIGKSNWLESDKMLRPENVFLEERENCLSREMTVKSATFLGGKYEISLEGKGEPWTVFHPAKIENGEKVKVYFNERDVCAF